RRVLCVDPGTTRGAFEARWRTRDPVATERVLRVAWPPRGWRKRPPPVLRAGAPPAVAHLYESVPRCGRALRGEADRVARGAPGPRELCGPPAPPESGHVRLRRGDPGVPHPSGSGGG